VNQEYKGYWLPKGEVLAKRYRIEDVVDEGGMGIVYLGFDTILQTKVSVKEYFPRKFAMRSYGETEIKVYKGQWEELYRSGLKKFIEEARIQTQFESMDSIVMVKDFFYANETAYMVMEYVEGESVKQYVERQGGMNPQEALELMRPILDSLSELHKNGLIHRDISPDNIILTENGKGMLIDFGAARFSDSQENKTMTVFFKRGYSAEEQYVEKSEKGAYTDVYGVSATMYFMLTGIRPEESIRRLIRDTVVPLGKFREIKLDARKKRCIMKGMAVEGRKRYSSVEKMCQDLYGAEHHVNYHAAIPLLLVVGLLVGTAGYCGWHYEGKGVGSAVDMAGVNSAAQEDFSGMTLTESAVNELAASESAVTESVCKMINVVGVKKATAKKKLKKLNIGKMSIRIKWAYSSKYKKGLVTHQSISAGKKIRLDEKCTVVLTVSKGKKPTPTPTPIATATPKPTRETEETKENEEEEFAGELPW
jgi:tRNA A-37 threonylcarbamoyl transferase component Bud32